MSDVLKPEAVALLGMSLSDFRRDTGRRYDAARKYLEQRGLRSVNGIIVPGITDADRQAEMDARRSPLPDAPCFRCGDRGWCSHRSIAA